ncbi:hypothetical protein IH824_17455, partial [candidate division KSB1 bacterium]|nr:hypothetical protein [candidate division KSB1 bacterium]
SKYQEAFEPPFLDMMGAFQTALREPDTTLFVAGFSFNDSHIAQPVLAALESNMNFRLVVCDPGFLTDDQIKDDPVTLTDTDAQANPFHLKLGRLAKAGDHRLLLFHGRFEDFSGSVYFDPDDITRKTPSELRETVPPLDHPNPE